MSVLNFKNKDSTFDYPPTIKELVNIFNSSINTPHNPMAIALENFEYLDSTIPNDQELIDTCLKFIIETSINVTFIENLFHNISLNPSATSQLISNHQMIENDRKITIETQGNLHINFIKQDGFCEGCISCDTHQDVSDLVPYYNTSDIDFFINLYIGMQAIQYFMEYLLYDVIPQESHIHPHLTPTNILNMRKFIINFCDQKIAA